MSTREDIKRNPQELTDEQINAQIDFFLNLKEANETQIRRLLELQRERTIREQGIPDHEVLKLHMQVMALAVRGSGTTDWACYIAPVPGVKSEDEWEKVHNVTGKKQTRAIGEALFPNWAKKLKYRD